MYIIYSLYLLFHFHEIHQIFKTFLKTFHQIPSSYTKSPPCNYHQILPPFDYHQFTKNHTITPPSTFANISPPSARVSNSLKRPRNQRPRRISIHFLLHGITVKLSTIAEISQNHCTVAKKQAEWIRKTGMKMRKRK